LEISEVRKEAYLIFFNCLPYVIPSHKLCKIYKDYMNQYPLENVLKEIEKNQSLDYLKKWIHRLEKCLKKKCDSFKKSCDKIEEHRVKKCKNGTCRK